MRLLSEPEKRLWVALASPTAFWRCPSAADWDCTILLWSGRAQLAPFPPHTRATDWFSEFIPISRMACGRYWKERKQNRISRSEKLLYPMQLELLYLLLVAKSIFFNYYHSLWHKVTYMTVLDHGICGSVHFTLPAWTVMYAQCCAASLIYCCVPQQS